MEKYGIGTDATVAEHIQKQLDRGFLLCMIPNLYSQSLFRYALKNAQLQFSATALGEGLIFGYCKMELDGLWKPNLRGKIEQAIKDIAAGTKSKEEVSIKIKGKVVSSFPILLGSPKCNFCLLFRFSKSAFSVPCHDRCNVTIFSSKW